MTLSRRSFLASSAAATAAFAAGPLFADHHKGEHGHDGQPFKISLAQWSLHRAFRAGEMDPVNFAAIAKDTFGIEGIEYVNQFYMDKAGDDSYLKQLKTIAEDNGVTSVLIMVDREGDLGDVDTGKRLQAVQNHVKWLDWAKALGCHSIRVNAKSSGSWDQQRDLAADGLRRLCETAEPYGLNVIVENHGGLSSNGQWLASVMEYVDHPRVGTLPDFQNFTINRQTGESYDMLQGIKDLMPYAKAVSAKSKVFADDGTESNIDYTKAMKIVLDHDYHSWVGIEWEGGEPSEVEGIKMTKALLERVRENVA